MYILWRVIVKEFLQLRQDKRMIPLIFGAPIIQITLFGFAVNTDVTNVPMVLVDQDKSGASRDLVNRFVHSGRSENGCAAGLDRARPWGGPWRSGSRALSSWAWRSGPMRSSPG